MRKDAGVSLVELLVMLVVIVIIASMTMPRMRGDRTGSQRIKCVNNLKNVALAVRIHATDNGDLYPGQIFQTNKVDPVTLTTAAYFRTLADELSTPKIIACPSDAERAVAESFTNLNNGNISYFASLTATEQTPKTFLAGDRNLMVIGEPVAAGLFTLSTNRNLAWSKAMHIEQGNIAMADGSVQQFSSSRLRQAVKESDPSTNLLLIP